MTTNSQPGETILNIPSTSDNLKWFQCYLKDPYVAGGVRITCDPILNKSYVLKENSTLYTVPTYVPELFTPFYLRCHMGSRVETPLHENGGKIRSVKW